ncbi:ATP-binding protein [bacterium]|nr:ATP-binding protein [bacterium]
MKLIDRRLDISQLLENKSFFLFGPRSTGKSTMIRRQLPKAAVYDLLDDEIFRRLLERPKLLAEENPDKETLIVIDEIQRLPLLLNEVHRLISSEGRTFLLTGSSARKLKRDGTNLLAGRAWRADLFPLTYSEIPQFDLVKFLNRGGLPQVYLSAKPSEELRAYTSMYLREEIQAEALTRNLQGFSTFLEVVALANGEELNFQSLASDCGVSASTLKNYIQILDDTLLGFSLRGFTKTKKRKAISRIKHYLFDVGVVNSLCRRGEIRQKSELFGKAFEHWIVQEVRACLSYSRSEHEMTYWRSLSQFEVDLLVGDEVAIEIKATSLVQDKHLKGLRALKEEGLIRKYVVVSLDSKARVTDDGIEILPWAAFMEQLWGGGLFD